MNFDPHPPPCTSLVRISVCNQVSGGNSYLEEPGRGRSCSHCSFQDFHSLTKALLSTPKYDRLKVSTVQWKRSPPAPGSLKNPSASTLVKTMYKQGNARGTGKVRRGTSSIHFHCPVPPVVQSYWDWILPPRIRWKIGRSWGFFQSRQGNCGFGTAGGGDTP